MSQGEWPPIKVSQDQIGNDPTDSTKKTIEIWMHRPAPPKWWAIFNNLCEDAGFTATRGGPSNWVALSSVLADEVDETLSLVRSIAQITNNDFVTAYQHDDDWKEVVARARAEEDLR